MTHKTHKKFSRRYIDTKTPKIIRFFGRTWENLCRVIEKLKSRYHKIVRLMNQKAMGAGLYSGSIQVS